MREHVIKEKSDFIKYSEKNIKNIQAKRNYIFILKADINTAFQFYLCVIFSTVQFEHISNLTHEFYDCIRHILLKQFLRKVVKMHVSITNSRQLYSIVTTSM